MIEKNPKVKKNDATIVFGDNGYCDIWDEEKVD